MEPSELALLHEHYRDTCTVMQHHRGARDRYFYFVLATVAVVLFDVVAPQDFSVVIGEALKAKLSLSVAPNLAYLRSIVWFLLLGLTIRYCQTALLVERQYEYVHHLEAQLSKHVQGGFTRESVAYLSNYPLFLHWAHYLYTLVSPLLLVGVVVAWTRVQIPGWPPWPGLVWFDCAVSVAIVVSVVLYLIGFHLHRKTDNEPRSRSRSARHS